MVFSRRKPIGSARRLSSMLAAKSENSSEEPQEKPREPMSSLRIYGIARTRAFRALWMAKELGLDYEHVPVEIGDAGARTPEFLAINPNGRLPVIVDDGFVLFELLAITLYLAKKHSPRQALSRDAGRRGAGVAVEPVGGHRGRSRRQHLVAACRPPAAGGARRRQARRGAEGAGVAVQGARRRGERSSPICSATTSPSPISMSPPSSAARSRWISSAVPNLKAWLTRCLERPAAPRGAGAQDQGRQRDAGGRDPADRPDQSPVTTTPGPFNPGRAIQAGAGAAPAGPAGRSREALHARAEGAARQFRRAASARAAQPAARQGGRGPSADRRGAQGAARARPTRCRISRSCCTRSSASDEALAQLDKALALAPGHLEALNNRGNVLLDLKRPADAVAGLRRRAGGGAASCAGADQPRQCPRRAGRGRAGARGLRRGARHRARASARALQPRQCAARARAASRMRSRPTTARLPPRRTMPAPGPTAAWRLRRSTATRTRSRATAGRSRLQPDNADVHFNAALSLLTVGDYRARLCGIRVALEARRHGARARTSASRSGSAKPRSRARPSCCTPSRAWATR